MSKKTEWTGKLAEYKASEMSQSQWYRENSILASTLSTWIMKDKNQDAKNDKLKSLCNSLQSKLNWYKKQIKLSKAK